MRRTILLVAAMAAALLIAGSVVLLSGLGRDYPPVAQAQTTSERQDDPARQDSSRAKGEAGRAVERGVSMRPATGGSQAQAVPRRAVEPPPLGLTERGKAALSEARRGEAQPAERPTIDVGAIPSGPSTNGAETNEPQPDTPALGTSFLGVADTGSFPPDTQIAVGPNNIVASANGAINILDKRGNSLSSQTLVNFFSPLGAEHNDVFDPWVVYDPYLNRFWMMAVSGRTTALSNIVIGLSDTQDATGGWRLWELDATVNGATDTQNWCDYPKLGFDQQAIYVTCNMFQLDTSVTPNVNRFQYSKLRIMTKNQFVNNTGIFWWDFWDLREGNTGTTTLFTLQPAQMFGAAASDGEFLVNARGGGGAGSTLDVWRVTNAAECCNGDNVGPNLANQGHGVNSYGPSDGARQPGSTTQIDNGDSRLLYAFWKNGRLSTGHTLACSGTPTNACGGFTELNVSGYPTISTLRNYAFTAGGQDVYFPAMSVNGADDRTMVFTVSDSSLSPTAAYLGIPSIADCPGNPTCFDGGTTAFRFGQNSNGYVRLDTRGRNRWGDYSGASPDPNGEGIWLAGEFAAATDDTWGVQAGLTYQTSPPPANDPFSGSQLISGTSASVGGTNRYATWQPGEPGSNSSTHSVWYRWTAPFSGPVTMNTCTSSFDTVLAVYTGFAVNGLTQVASNDDTTGCGTNDRGSQVTFNAVAGTTYRISIRGFLGTEGTFTLGLKMPPQNDNFANAQALSGNSATSNGTTLAATRETGEPDHYVTSPPDSDLWVGDHSVWYSWTAPFTGKVELNTCTSKIDGILAVYTGSSLGTLSRVADNNNACPNNPDGTTNWGSKITFNATNGTTYRMAVGDAGGLRENTFTLRLIDRTPPTVATTIPANNVSGVAAGANVIATFSEAMKAGTINTTTFNLKKSGTSTNLTATVTYDAATKKATLNPSANLQSGATYVATVTTGAKDLAGNSLDQNPTTAGNQAKTWTFKVG
jgi:hypothetical protein